MTAKTATKKPSALENAQKILHDLETKKADLAASCNADQRELESIAFAAHAAADQKALARLETIKSRAVNREADMKSLDAAIAEAKRNVESAKANEAAAEQKRLAGETRVIVDRIDSLFASADTHFKQAFDALKAADGRIEELHVRGFAFPTAIQVRASALFALQTYLMTLPKYWWNELSHGGVRFQAPHERRSFQQCWSQMATSIGREIGQRLGESKQKEVA
jgi:hypothetical protein